jgi:hypothetical protein
MKNLWPENFELFSNKIFGFPTKEKKPHKAIENKRAVDLEFFCGSSKTVSVNFGEWCAGDEHFSERF